MNIDCPTLKYLTVFVFSMSSRSLILVTIPVIALLTTVAAAYADPSPNGPGQPGAPETTCGSPDATQTPGDSASNGGSPFAGGTADAHYAGNPDTPSLAHANSPHAVSQYDISCFQQTQHNH
jgi:hypothetical protein